MTVKELIKELQEFPEDFNIYWCGNCIIGDPTFIKEKDCIEVEFDFEYDSVDY